MLIRLFRLELSVLNFADNMQWNQHACSGDAPRARKNFASCSRNNRVYVFGGVSDFGKALSAVHVLNTDVFKWIELPFQQVPALQCHSAAFYDDSTILIFGGNDTKQYYNDLYAFNIGTILLMILHFLIFFF